MAYRQLFAASLAGTLGLAAQPACAQTTDSAAGQATILDESVLVKLRDLDFGRIVPSGSGGMVTINQSTGAITGSGGVTLVSPGDHRAFFRSRVPALRLMVVSVDPNVVLTRVSGTEQMIANLRYSIVDGAGIRLLFGLPIGFLTTGNEQLIAVGGTLTVSGTQAPGLYRGTFNLSVNFP